MGCMRSKQGSFVSGKHPTLGTTRDCEVRNLTDNKQVVFERLTRQIFIKIIPTTSAASSKLDQFSGRYSSF